MSENKPSLRQDFVNAVSDVACSVSLVAGNLLCGGMGPQAQIATEYVATKAKAAVLAPNK